MAKGSKPANTQALQVKATAVLLAQVSALELLGKALIASHPEPAGLLAAWEELKFHSIEQLMTQESPIYANDDFRSTLHAQLGMFETILRIAADSRD